MLRLVQWFLLSLNCPVDHIPMQIAFHGALNYASTQTYESENKINRKILSKNNGTNIFYKAPEVSFRRWFLSQIPQWGDHLW